MHATERRRFDVLPLREQLVQTVLWRKWRVLPRRLGALTVNASRLGKEGEKENDQRKELEAEVIQLMQRVEEYRQRVAELMARQQQMMQ
jgi:chromosome segregation ATPase